MITHMYVATIHRDVFSYLSPSPTHCEIVLCFNGRAYAETCVWETKLLRVDSCGLCESRNWKCNVEGGDQQLELHIKCVEVAC